MKKWPLWLWLLAKRLYRKPAFLALLVLIPLFVIGYRFSVADDAGVIAIGLVQEAPDSLASQIIGELAGSDSLIRYEVYPTPESAQRQLMAGKLDGVWIFHENFSKKVAVYAADPVEENACVTGDVKYFKVENGCVFEG